MFTIDQATPVVAIARDFAWKAHADIKQVRRYTGESYIVHPAMVAGLVASVPHTSAMLAAAWLHDVVEDTPVSIGVVHEVFGNEIGNLVDWLTDLESNSNRATRKKEGCERWCLAPAEAQTIKVADLISNTLSIVVHDVSFAGLYLKEKERLLEALTKADPTLHALATNLLQQEQQNLMYRTGALLEPS